jgi:hypothetical protein
LNIFSYIFNLFFFNLKPSSSPKPIDDLKIKSKTTITSTNILSIRRSHLPLMNAGNGLYPTTEPSSSSEIQRNRKKVK